MLREIKNAIYCIASYTGNRHFVECDSEDELAAYVAEGECKGYSATSVTRICTDGSRPRVAVKSNPYYKRVYRKFLKLKKEKMSLRNNQRPIVETFQKVSSKYSIRRGISSL